MPGSRHRAPCHRRTRHTDRHRGRRASLAFAVTAPSPPGPSRRSSRLLEPSVSFLLRPCPDAAAVAARVTRRRLCSRGGPGGRSTPGGLAGWERVGVSGDLATRRTIRRSVDQRQPQKHKMLWSDRHAVTLDVVVLRSGRSSTLAAPSSTASGDPSTSRRMVVHAPGEVRSGLSTPDRETCNRTCVLF